MRNRIVIFAAWAGSVIACEFRASSPVDDAAQHGVTTDAASDQTHESNASKDVLPSCADATDRDCDGIADADDGCDDRALGERIIVDAALSGFLDASYRGYDFSGDFLGLLNVISPSPFTFGGELSAACVAQGLRGIRVATPQTVLADPSASADARSRAEALAALSPDEEDSAFAHVLDDKGVWLIARTPDAAFNAAYRLLERYGVRFFDVEGKDTTMPAQETREPWTNLPKTSDLRRAVAELFVANIKGIRFFVTSGGTGNGTDQEFYMRRAQMPLAHAVAQSLTDHLGASPCELEHRPQYLLDPSNLAPFCTPMPAGETCAIGHCAPGCDGALPRYPRECNYSFDPPADPLVPEDIPFVRYTYRHLDPMHRGCGSGVVADHECEPGEASHPTDYTSYLGVPKFVTEIVRRSLWHRLAQRHPNATHDELVALAATFRETESIEAWDGWDPLHTDGALDAAEKCRNLIRAKYPSLVVGAVADPANDATNGECIFDLVNEVALHIRLAEDGLPAFPRARIGIMAYTPHAHLPRFPIAANVAVNVSTGNPEDIGNAGSFRDQMIAWKQKAQASCADGMCPELQRYLYTGAVNKNLPYVVDPRRWVSAWRQEALPVLFLETTYSSITYAPVLFALGRLAWKGGDERAVVEAALTEYMDGAFQCAKAPISRIYERWWAQVDQTGMSEWDFALSVRDLDEAMTLAQQCASPQLEARLTDFADYLLQVHLLKALAKQDGEPTLSARLLDHYGAVSCHNTLAVHAFRFGVEPHDFHLSLADQATFLELPVEELRARCRARSFVAARAAMNEMLAAHPPRDVSAALGRSPSMPFVGTSALAFSPVFFAPPVPRAAWWGDESQFALAFNDTQFEAFRGFASDAPFTLRTQWMTTPGFLAPTVWTLRHASTASMVQTISNPDDPTPTWVTLSYDTSGSGVVSVEIDGKKTTSDFVVNVPKHEPFVELPQAGEIIYSIGTGDFYAAIPSGVTRLLVYAGTTTFDVPASVPVFTPVTFEATSGADLDASGDHIPTLADALPVETDGPYVYVDVSSLGATPDARVLRVGITSGIFRFLNIPTALAAHPAQVMQAN